MMVAIYQIIPELDNSRMLYNSLEYIKKAHGGTVPAEIYERVFEGEVDGETTKDIFYIFNANFPKGYKGRSLSVSDVVEFICSDSKSIFYFCDSVGFERIRFKKERAMTFVQNRKIESYYGGDKNEVLYRRKRKFRP